MYSMKQVRDEIRAEIDHRMSQNEREIEPAWVAQAVLQAHRDIAGEDADFYLVSARHAIHHEARSLINQIEKGNPPGSQQITMEGFNHLQKYYIIERNGRRPAVRIDLMSRSELIAKRDEHRTRSETEAEHTRELDRYIELRFGANAA